MVSLNTKNETLVKRFETYLVSTINKAFAQRGGVAREYPAHFYDFLGANDEFCGKARPHTLPSHLAAAGNLVRPDAV